MLIPFKQLAAWSLDASAKDVVPLTSTVTNVHRNRLTIRYHIESGESTYLPDAEYQQ